MKPVLILPFLFLYLTACTKKEATGITAPSPVVQVNSSVAPVAYGGIDKTLFLPTDSCELAGSYTGTNVQSVVWRQLSGPGSRMERTDLLATKVTNMEKGVYAFELTVTNSSQQKGKDTVIVTVSDNTGPALIFDELTWIFPWYAAVEVQSFLTQVPAGVEKKVFIKRGFQTAWSEVPPLSSNSHNHPYEYFLETRPDGAGMYNYGSLYIFYYGSNTSDKPSIKVVF